MRQEKIIKDLYNIIRKELVPELTYHSIDHTRDVQNVCLFYIDHYQIEKKEAELLEIAAVGHDIGFTITYSNHEEKSAEITTDLMSKYDYSEKDQDVVRNLILATKIPQQPKTFLAQLICDADLDYLGRSDFKKIGALLKEEWTNFEIVPNIDEDFDMIQVGFLKVHFYHTDYAAKHRGPVKLKNLDILEKRLKKKASKSRRKNFSKASA